MEIEYIITTGPDGKDYLVVKRTPTEPTKDMDGNTSVRKLLPHLNLEDGRAVTQVSKTEFKIVGTNIVLKLK